MQIYYITDRTAIPSRDLADLIDQATAAGVDWIQIREKDLPARRLLALTEAAVRAARRYDSTRIVVNDRLDAALAAGADGVHLGTRSLPVEMVRSFVPPEFLVGASCHSVAEALAAEAAGADYILLGPIFATPSKLQYGPPLGLSTLREVTHRVSIPVLALGGINVERATLCREHGASGIAAIRLFQECESLEQLVHTLHDNLGRP